MTQHAESASGIYCPDVESLSAWFDGEDDTVSGQHVTECGSCSGKINAYGYIQRELAQTARPAAGLNERIKLACVREREPQRLLRWGLSHFANPRLAAAATLLLTLSGAFYFGNANPASSGSTEASLAGLPRWFTASPAVTTPVMAPAAPLASPLCHEPVTTPAGQALRVTLELPATSPQALANSVQQAGFTLLSPVRAQAATRAGCISYSFEMVSARP